MKLTILAPALALCGGLALAQNPGTTTAKPQDTKRSSEHKMTAEIVSTDQTAQQITVRKLSMGGTTSGSQSTGAPSTGTGDDSATVTLRVEGKALTRLSSVKSGDMVTISCRAQGDMPSATGTSPTTGGSSTSSTTSGSTGSTTSGAGTASTMGGISNQAMADKHCASVTDISKGR